MRTSYSRILQKNQTIADNPGNPSTYNVQYHTTPAAQWLKSATPAA